MYVELADAVAVTGCNAAGDSNGKLLCQSFQAEIEEWEEHESDSTRAYLVGSGRNVTVFFKDPKQGMAPGDKVVIGRHADGRWILVAWLC